MLDLQKTPPKQRTAAICENLDEKLLKAAYEGNGKTARGMNFSGYLESQDPTSAHDDKSMDAFGRVCQHLGIVPTADPFYNRGATTLEQMAGDKRTRVLIGEIASRAWRRVAYGGDQMQRLVLSTDAGAGSLMQPYSYSMPRLPLLQPAIPVSELVANTQGIPGRTYRPFYVEDVDQAEVNMRVGEGADIPVVNLRESEKTIILKKYGRMIKASYEALRYMPVDTFSFFVARVALAVEAEKVERILDVLVGGDGSSGTPENFNATALDALATGKTLTLKAWLAFKMKFQNPFMMTHSLSRADTALKAMLLNAGTANIPLANAGALIGGQGVTPINQLADTTRAGWLASAPADVFVAFDKRLAVERIFEIGGTIQETDRWIENQTEGLTQTEVEGYDIIEPEAVKTLTLVTS